MSNHTIDTDFTIHVYHSGGSSSVGHDSKYVNTEHLGTNNKIEGWPWDRRMWPTTKQSDNDNYAPNFWNPNTNFIPENYFQSGYGAGKDILFTGLFDRSVNNTTRWNASIHSGKYYRYSTEYCLFSKYHKTQYFSPNNTYSGLLYYANLLFNPQPTHPITVRRYIRNQATGDISFDVNAIQRYGFTGTTISGVEQTTVYSDRSIDTDNIDFDQEEFIVDNTNYSPPWLITNVGFRNIGREVTTISGGAYYNPDDIGTLELLGVSDETVNQQFFTKYFPIDRYNPVEIWVYADPHNSELYTTVSGVKIFSPGDNKEVYIDYDRGIIEFGNNLGATGGLAGHVPEVGKRIAIRYTAGLEIQYEPDYSKNLYEPKTLNLHPLYQATHRGFVQVSTKEDQVGSIALTTDLTQIGVNTYTVETGNSTAQIIATVLNQDGLPMEGVSVIFTLPDPYLGSFSDGSQSKSASTNLQGKASVFYIAPSSIDELGNATDTVVYDGSNSILEIDGVPAPDTISGEFYLWKVKRTDHVLGTNSSDLSSEYSTYKTESEIGSGSTRVESEYREAYDLPTIASYTTGDLVTGAKKLIIAQESTVNPHTGDIDANAFSPLYPNTIQDIGTSTAPKIRLTFNNVLLPDPKTSNSFKAYFAAGGNSVTCQASATGASGKTITAKPINLDISINDNANGVYIAKDLSTVPSALLNNVRDVDNWSDVEFSEVAGRATALDDDYQAEKLWIPASGVFESFDSWYRRTKRGDSKELGLNSVTLSTVGEIPLGFRVGDSNTTVAGMLGMVTFVDINPTTESGYFGATTSGYFGL